MVKYFRSMIVVFLICLIAAGCNSPSPASDSSAPPSPGTQSRSAQSATIVHEGESVLLIRAMMGLDYPSMTVADFNGKIQAMCADAGTTVFEVLSNAYDHFSVYDDTGEFVDIVFSDRELEAFIKTTLEYSAQEIFGEPVHLGSIMYMTTPELTAEQLYQKKQQMSPEEWNAFFEEHLEEITIYPILSYSIEANIADPATLSVSDRDSRINAVHTAVIEWVLGMDAETAGAENLEEMIAAELDAISAGQSDAAITIKCSIQMLERDMPA